MLNDYSSLLEVIAAAYFTMCIDDVLKSLWTPQYVGKVNQLLDGLNEKLADGMRKRLVSHIESISADIKKHLKVKSSLMLLFCSFLLFVAGAESHHKWLTSVNVESEMLVRISFLCSLCILLGKWTLKNYKALLISLSLMGLVLLLLYIHSFSIVERYSLSEHFVICILVCVLIFPMCWQILLCWACSSLYYDYLQLNTKREEELLALAQVSYSIKQAASAPEEYRASVSRDLLNSSSVDGQDSPQNFINDTFLCRMDSVCQLPSFVKLCYFSLRFHKERENVKPCDKKHIFLEKKPEYVGQGLTYQMLENGELKENIISNNSQGVNVYADEAKGRSFLFPAVVLCAACCAYWCIKSRWNCIK